MSTRGRWQLGVVLLAIPLGVLVAACQSAPAPASKAAAPAAAPAVAKLIIAADMVQGSKNIPADKKENMSCVLSSRFPKNGEMVWRIRVTDPATGNVLDKAGLSSVQVALANGTTLDAQYGFHPKDPPGEGFWTASWLVPKDAPTGTLNYTITAKDSQGRTGEWKPFSTATSLPVITNDVLGDVPAKG